jgi:hypothetical protein
MIHRRNDVELKLSVACSLKYSRVDLDFFNTRTIELLECGDYSRLFACTGWPVY